MRACLSVRCLPVIAILAVTVTTLSAQGGSQRSGGAAAGTRLIVRAISNAGQPVTDLKASEISIRTDGKPREIVNLELVSAASAGAAAPAATAPASVLPPPFATNSASAPAAGGGREFLILLDDDGVGAGREEPVRVAVAQLMSQAAPTDRFGLIGTRGRNLEVPSTTQHEGVKGALAKFVGGGSASETSADMVCRAKRGLQTLTAALRTSTIGRTIVFISPGLPASPSNSQPVGRASADNIQPTELCQIRSTDFDELSTAAAGSPANVFVLHYPEGLASAANVSAAQQGLENITGSISGEFLRLGGGTEASLGRIARETSSYYIATLDDAPGAVRRVDARVSRADVRLSARPGGAPAAPAGATAKAGSPRDMMRVATMFRDVPIRAAGFVSRQPGTNELKVVTLFEPEDPSAKLTAAMVGLFDEKGTLKAQWTAQAAELGRSPIVAALTAVPGKYRMRVAASNASGNGGTTDYDLTVQLPEAAPVKLSDMLLGVGQGGFSPKLAFTSADAAVIGFIEVYGVGKDAKLETTFEIIKPSGEVLGSGQGTVGAGPGEDARIAYGGFGIATLEPGDYTMRATINVDGKQAGIATRTLRKLK